MSQGINEYKRSIGRPRQRCDSKAGTPADAKIFWSREDHLQFSRLFKACRPDLRCLALAIQILSKEVPWQLTTGNWHFERCFYVFFLPSFTTLLAQSLRVSKLSETRLSENQRQWFSDSIRNARRYWNARKDELCSTDTDSLQWTLFDFHIFPALLTGLQVF